MIKLIVKRLYKMTWEKLQRKQSLLANIVVKNGISHELINKLQSLRTELGFPFIITSGYRCEEHPIEARKKNTRNSCRRIGC